MSKSAPSLSPLTPQEKEMIDKLSKLPRAEILQELKDNLQTAVWIELATIPIYLFGYYSIERARKIRRKYQPGGPVCEQSRRRDHERCCRGDASHVALVECPLFPGCGSPVVSTLARPLPDAPPLPQPGRAAGTTRGHESSDPPVQAHLRAVVALPADRVSGEGGYPSER